MRNIFISIKNKLAGHEAGPSDEGIKEERIDDLMDRIDSLPPDEQKSVDRLIEKLITRRNRLTAKRTKMVQAEESEDSISQEDHAKQEKFREWLQKEMTYRNLTAEDLLSASSLDHATLEKILQSQGTIGYEECDAIADGLCLPSDTVFKAAGLSTFVAMRYAEAPFWIDWIRVVMNLNQMTRKDAQDYAKFVYRRYLREKVDPTEDHYLTREAKWLMAQLTPKQQAEAYRYIQELAREQDLTQEAQELYETLPQKQRKEAERYIHRLVQEQEKQKEQKSKGTK